MKIVGLIEIPDWWPSWLRILTAMLAPYIVGTAVGAAIWFIFA